MITGSIYYFYHNEKLLYIGSSENIKRRNYTHKYCIKSEDKSLLFYKYCFENNIVFNDLKLNIETNEYNSLEDLRKNEGIKQKELNPICNKCIAGRTQEEWYNDEKTQKKYKEYRDSHKEKIFAYNKKYYIENKEKMLINRKEYCEKNKEEIRVKRQNYYQKNKEEIVEKVKIYAKNNPDKIKANNDKNYESHKEKRIEYVKQYQKNNSELIKCNCGSTVKKYKLSEHIKTKKHIRFLNE